MFLRHRTIEPSRLLDPHHAAVQILDVILAVRFSPPPPLAGRRTTYYSDFFFLSPSAYSKAVVARKRSGTDNADKDLMGNKPAKQKREEILVRAMPPLDQAFVRWLARDLQRLHAFAPRNPRSIRPPDHYIEYMRLYGLLDLDMDDPDLAHLVK